ncbi:hypothetical protein GN958_ATG15999, partial [Phytophthora infestans]
LDFSERKFTNEEDLEKAQSARGSQPLVLSGTSRLPVDEKATTTQQLGRSLQAVLDFYADGTSLQSTRIDTNSNVCFSCIVLRSRPRGTIPSSAAVADTPGAAGDNQLAAAQEVARQNYLSDINAAGAREAVTSQNVETTTAADTTRNDTQLRQPSPVPRFLTTRQSTRCSLETTATFIASSPYDVFEIEDADVGSSTEEVSDDAFISSTEVHTGTLYTLLYL